MDNNIIDSIKNTYQLTVDGKAIPFKVSITDIGDDKISKLRNENIKTRKKDKIYNRLYLVIVALLYLFAGICIFAPKSSQIYYIAAIATIIFTCLAFIDVIIDIRSGRYFRDVADIKSKLRDENIKAKKKDKKHDRLYFIIVALLFIFMDICIFVPKLSQIYYIAAIAAIIFTCLAFIDAIIDIRSGRHFLNVAYDNANEIKGWNAYQTASEIAFALDNIEPNSEIKLIKDVVKMKEPNNYLQIKDNDTKRINTYWLDDFSWEVHDKNEVILIANSTKINDITSSKPVYEMKLLVPQWIKDEYIMGRNLFA